MTQFDLEKQDKGEWFTFFDSHIDDKGNIVYDDPKSEAGRVCLRNVSPKLQELLKSRIKKAEFVLNPDTRRMERIVYFEELSIDEVKQRTDELYDYAIVAWESMFDGKGNPIECTKDNKSKLMNIPSFDRFITRCFQILGEVSNEAEEEQGKNLLTG